MWELTMQRPFESTREEISCKSVMPLDVPRYQGRQGIAFCKAVLNPRHFDNLKFWNLILQGKLSPDFIKLANCMRFNHGVHKEKYVLDTIKTYACWPDISAVIAALKTMLPKDEAKELLLNCCYLHHDSQQFHDLMDEFDSVYDLQHIQNWEPSTTNLYYGLDITHQHSNSSILLQILSGFMAVVGSAALLLALTSLSIPISPISAVTGVALLAGSYGLFKYANNQPTVLVEVERPQQYYSLGT
jgi:hypothetical protein